MPPEIDADLFIGREREMAELTTALDGALDGKGGIAMLAGEPGIGKTRIIEELTALARNRGALVVLGACYEGGSAPPYWPWTQVIRSLVTEPSDAVVKSLGPRAGVIAELVPEIGNLFPDLEPAPTVGPEQARFRLFDSVASFLSEIAISQPMVVVLDDLHWADRSTLDLLEFIVRDVSAKPLLIVGTYRDMELSRSHPLTRSLATLTRARGFKRILLRGLDGNEVKRLVETISDIELPPEVIEEILARTEGNPFFVGEVTRDLSREVVDRGDEFDALKFRIPDSVREAIGVRLNNLSEECNNALRTASVIGRGFDFALLAALHPEESEEALLDLVGEATAAAVAREVPGRGERYEFSHALIGQTLAEELTVGRRIRLHARIVTAIEELHADNLDEHLTELTYHCIGAETVVEEEKLIRYSLLAGEEALRSHAFEEAIAYFEQGLAVHGSEQDNRVQADLLFGIGRVQVSTLADVDLQVAVDTLNGAFDIYAELGDSDRAVAVAEYPIPMASGIHGAMRLTEQALALVPENSHAAGKLLARHGLWVWIENQDHELAVRLLDRALVIADRESDRRLEMWTRVNLASVHFWQNRLDITFEHAHRATELAREFDDLLSSTQALQFQGLSRLRQGDIKSADKYFTASVTVAERLGSQHRLAMAIGSRAEIALTMGDWEETRALTDRALTLAPSDFKTLTLRVILEHQLGHVDAAEPFLDKLANAAAPNMMNAAMAAMCAAYVERSSESLEIADAAVSRNIALAPDRFRQSNVLPLHALSAMLHHDREASKEHYVALLDDPQNFSTFGFSSQRFRALVARTAGEVGSAEAHFEVALKETRRAGARPDLSWTCADYAEMLLDQGDVIDAPKIERLINESAPIAHDLGMKPLNGRFSDLEERLAAHRDKPPFPDGITAREVEVLRHLAAGRTNQQIADELVIAVNTVTTHVANVLSKTGSANRTEAAAYAAQKGLVEA